MKKISYVRNVIECELLNHLGFEELIVGHRDFSRFSDLDDAEFDSIVQYALKHNISLVFEWDALCEETKLRKLVEKFKAFPSFAFNKVRVLDMGVMQFIKDHYSWLKLQVILENGHHNSLGPVMLSNYLGGQLDRLILSNECSVEMIESIHREIKLHVPHEVELEILAFGPLLLFYSARHLLAPQKLQDYQSDRFIQYYASSEESPHTGFPLMENQHGTFMFNVKDICLFKVLQDEKLRVSNIIQAIRFDFRHLASKSEKENEFKMIAISLLESFTRGLDYQSADRQTISGFFKTNKTSSLFKKLKNQRTLRFDENYLGEVVDVVREKNITILIKNKLNVTLKSKLILVTPEGKRKEVSVTKLHLLNQLHINENQNELQVKELNKDQLYQMSYLSGVVFKTQIYLQN